MIEVKDLRFTYPGNESETIKGIDFTIGNGEIFGFLGPSGAGKSTTQKIIIGILKSYGGSVKVLGEELLGQKSRYYEHIGVSFELPNLYSKFSALENLNFFASLYKGPTEDPMKLLSMVGLEKDARTRVESFSKGMKMRLNFCRALLNKPRILFLDEPASGLDPVNARIMREIIKAKREEGTTIFVTTHNMHVAEDICDRVAFIIDGQLPLIDSPRNLKIEHGRPYLQVEYRTNGETVKREFPLEGIGSNKDFLTLLKEERVETIHSQEATLEDIFIKVTGRRLQ